VDCALTMTLAVKLFAKARDLAGADVVRVDVPDAGTVRDLKSALAGRYPALVPLMPSLLIAVGNEYATDDTKLSATSDVACFPPVSGG
jgi:molybdopterin synthase sulfur carrier subunit